MISLRVGKQFINTPRDVVFLNKEEVLIITWEGRTFIASGNNVREIPTRVAAYLLAKRLISTLPSA